MRPSISAVQLVAVAVIIAAAGLVAHNLLSLPLSALDPSTVGPVLAYLALLLWYARSDASAAARWSLIGWTLLNLIAGGILTALPLPFLPFVPEQTFAHYLAHVIYAAAQLPLLLLLVRPQRTRAATV